jgi:hypothetical protein
MYDNVYKFQKDKGKQFRIIVRHVYTYYKIPLFLLHKVL